MRLIDADATLREMWKRLWALEDRLEKEHGLDVIERFNIQKGFEEGLHAVIEQPTVESPVKAVKVTKDGKTVDALIDKQRMLIYRRAITYEMAQSLGYTIEEVE